MFKTILSALLIIGVILVSEAFSQTETVDVINDGLVIEFERPAIGQTISPDPVAAAITVGNWSTPEEGKEFKVSGETAGTWEKITADENGWFSGKSLRYSYIYVNYHSDEDAIVLLDASAHEMVYVNGVPRSGNPYGYKDDYDFSGPRFDYSLVPVKLHKGDNELLFKCERGRLKVRIHKIEPGLVFDGTDLTIPDLRVGKHADTYGALPVVNATENTYKGLTIKSWVDGGEPEYYNMKDLLPLSIFKTPFHINVDAKDDTGVVVLHLAVLEDEKVLSESSIDLKVLAEGRPYRETFFSEMDGSLQYYSVNAPDNLQYEKPALFLSLHGAGVEAFNQAQAYGHKNWGYVVAPTNRRPYGYNWENWGRLDALEVLAIAEKKFNIDEDRVYLTGHSMGGHGTWQLGVNYPDKFAAIGPSAGWISIWSYRIGEGIDSTEIGQMLMRSNKHSDTYAFTTNLKRDGIYIIHGDQDDNVPPEQTYSMIENLSKFHKDFDFHEEPGAGHWWDNSDELGADCVDWKPLFDFFAHHAVAGKKRVRNIDFVTSNPAVTSKNYWIEIINQDEQQMMSKINFTLDYGLRRFTGTTDNISMFAIDASMLPEDAEVIVNVDGQSIEGIDISKDSKIWLAKENGTWSLSSKYNTENKYPERCGNFREVLNHKVLFVLGTKGNDEEDEWAFEKARYDAERIWYRGNGAIEIINDNDFDAAKYKDRNVVLYGNANTNSAWEQLLDESPVQVGKNEIKVGDKTYKGKDYACLMIRPRKDSETASVAVVSGTGLKGMHLSDLSLYYHQYVGLPDVLIYNSDILKSDEDGIKFTGYFGNDWSLEKGEFIEQK